MCSIDIEHIKNIICKFKKIYNKVNQFLTL